MNKEAMLKEMKFIDYDNGFVLDFVKRETTEAKAFTYVVKVYRGEVFIGEASSIDEIILCIISAQTAITAGQRALVNISVHTQQRV